MRPFSAFAVERPPAALSELAAGVSIGRSLGRAIRPPIAAALAWNRKRGFSFKEVASEE